MTPCYGIPRSITTAVVGCISLCLLGMCIFFSTNCFCIAFARFKFVVCVFLMAFWELVTLYRCLYFVNYLSCKYLLLDGHLSSNFSSRGFHDTEVSRFRVIKNVLPFPSTFRDSSQGYTRFPWFLWLSSINFVCGAVQGCTVFSRWVFRCSHTPHWPFTRGSGIYLCALCQMSYVQDIWSTDMFVDCCANNTCLSNQQCISMCKQINISTFRHIIYGRV